MEQWHPASSVSSNKIGGKGEMTKAPSKLQDLRRKIYIKAKAETSWRFWGIYVHVCKIETLREAYLLAKQNKGAPGIDGVTFDAIEAEGSEEFLQKIQNELVTKTYYPNRNRKKEIPKAGGKFRTLNIPVSVTELYKGP
jgi:RNA-directed DNA polymerase